jgi:Ca2+/Na+ antiporter
MTETLDTQTESNWDPWGLLIGAAAIVMMTLFWLLGWELLFLLGSVVLISVVIWQACDPFAEAAQWVGNSFRVPGSVRGATLDAIASSMPELFSGIFFVLVAVAAAENTEVARAAAGSEGYGSALATAAGSAVYNMILIPACCALVISVYRKNRPTIEIEDEVIARDGIWFISCEILLILFLFQDQVHWWMAVVFIGLYAIYIVQLYRDAQIYRRKLQVIKQQLAELSEEADPRVVAERVQIQHKLRVSPLVVRKAREEFERENGADGPSPLGDDEPDDEPDDGAEDGAPETAGVLFGLLHVPLNKATVWWVLLLSTAVAAGACFFLVAVTNRTATLLGVPTFFVAVILAAAASSVPDTFLSIGASMRGDDSGAVSNAFGSNIFDICICLSIPLLLNSYLVGWEPVHLTQDGKPIPGLVGLRILLVTLTIATLAIIWHNRQLSRRKAFILCGLYILFITYAVLGSLGILF